MGQDPKGMGALLNLNYKYNDRYMIQTILRSDAHSSFGANHRWGLFKGVSVGWRFSQEPFMKSIPFLGESMLRASWGVSGRQPTDAYARFATYESTGTGKYMKIIPPLRISRFNWIISGGNPFHRSCRPGIKHV